MAEAQPDLPPQLSVIVPAYNEAATIVTAIDRLTHALKEHAVEILIVDDGSTDGTAEKIRGLGQRNDDIHAFFHKNNRGKGAALRTAFAHVRGQVIVIQDADLEYDPHDIPSLIQPILEGRADVAYGSRFRSQPQGARLFWHRIANMLLTCLSNLVNNLNLSDMETGYKAFSLDVVKQLEIRENRFGVEPEITAKVAKLICRVHEIPVSYHARKYSEGKKIGVRDALRAVWCVLRYRISD